MFTVKTFNYYNNVVKENYFNDIKGAVRYAQLVASNHRRENWWTKVEDENLAQLVTFDYTGSR